jgi:hypothetical protein
MRRTDGVAAVAPGQPWQLDAMLSEGDFQVTSPTGEKVAATVVSRGRNVRLALPPATTVGHFQVKQNGAVVAAGAVNPDPRESDTRLMPLTELARGNVKLVTSEGELLGTAQQRPLWPMLAGVAVGAFGLEMLLLALWRKLPQRTEVKS